MVDKIERLQKRAVSVYIPSAALSRGWFSRDKVHHRLTVCTKRRRLRNFAPNLSAS